MFTFLIPIYFVGYFGDGRDVMSVSRYQLTAATKQCSLTPSHKKNYL